MRDFLKEAANVRPSQRQLDWYETGFYAFIHFGVNTFTDREWGDGTEPESIFNPVRLDCDQWVRSIKAAGMKGMVLTAKHHDGFCLWPTKYTEHNVMNSPLKRDVVKEAAEACRRGGIRFGIYLSPWDRNNPLYGTPAYNDYFCSQLEELLTQYGDIFCVWFDNACGEGPNGKKQYYDFPRYIELIRRLQPGAVVFNDFGPDVRWCGNEGGIARHSEWAVVPSELCVFSPLQTGPGPLAEEGSLSFMYSTDEEIGTLPMILYSKGLVFAPAEINMSIRPGWFWHEKEEPHSLERLYRTWLTAYGANAGLNLNIPPTREGLLDERDVRRLQEFGDLIRREFGTPIVSLSGEALRPEDKPVPLLGEERREAIGVSGGMYGLPEGYRSPEKLPEQASSSQPTYRIELPEPVPQQTLRHIVLEEEICEGQRVESFQVVACYENGTIYPIVQGTCIGNRKICDLADPFAAQNPLTDDREGSRVKALLVKITAARGPVCMRSIRVY